MEFALLVWFVEVFSSTSYIMDVGTYVGLSFLCFLVITIVTGLASVDENWDECPLQQWWTFCVNKAAKPWTYILVLLIGCNMVGDLLPNKDAAYKIAAAYGVQQAYMAASESEDVKRMAGKSLLVLETSMDRYLSEGLAKAAGITVNTETVSGAVSSVKETASEVITKEDVQKVKDAAVTKLVGTLTGPQQ